jgi:predicted HNH restriction endonuclease
VAGGPNIPENLIVLCSKCHDDIHAGRRQLPPHIMG